MKIVAFYALRKGIKIASLVLSNDIAGMLLENGTEEHARVIAEKWQEVFTSNMMISFAEQLWKKEQ